MEKVIVFFQQRFEKLLRESITQDVQVLEWICVDNIDEEIEQYVCRIHSYCRRNEVDTFFLMVFEQSIKEILFRMLEPYAVKRENILDVYKAYMSKFPRRRYRRLMDGKKEALDGIILGISHGMTGILEEEMPGNVCNFCESFQDIYFNKRVLQSVIEEYPDKVKNLKYAVIDMYDYNYFNFDVIQTGAFMFFLEESGWECEYRTPWRKEHSVEQINQSLQKMWMEGTATWEQEALQRFFPKMQEKDEEVYRGYTILKERNRILPENEIEAYMRKEGCLSAIQAKSFEETIQFQLDNFIEIVRLLLDLNPEMQIFLTLLPKYCVVEEREKEANQIWKQIFENLLKDIIQRFDNIKLLDYKQCEEFSGKREYYYDLTHFNYLGACQFTKFLSEQIKGETKTNAMDWKIQKVNELLDAIDNGQVNGETIEQFTYWHMVALMEMSKQLEGGREFYIKIKDYLERINIQRLRNKEKIVVGFMANFSSTWIGDELYHLLDESERFEPYVFVLANNNGQGESLMKEEYAKHLAFFRERKLRVVETFSPDKGEYTWEEMGIKPDVCIWISPWIDLFKGSMYLLNFSLDTLHTFITYCFRGVENKKGDFVFAEYNQIIHNVVWRSFCESRHAVEMSGKYSYVGKSNAVYTGYPKMDPFYDGEAGEDNIWDKLLKKAGNPNAKKVIYAPHHTLEDWEPIHFSTFAVNYLFMLELAEKYQDEIVWVVRPHPLLKYKAIRAGLFQNEEEWEAYVGRWRQLKNAEFMEGGDYSDLFKDSDAMINDCCSYLTEYVYANKPLLRLVGEGQRFDEFGEKNAAVHYAADGADKDAVEEFLKKVVLEGKDEKQAERASFFEENLNYMNISGKNAAGNIFDVLYNELK